MNAKRPQHQENPRKNKQNNRYRPSPEHPRFSYLEKIQFSKLSAVTPIGQLSEKVGKI